MVTPSTVIPFLLLLLLQCATPVYLDEIPMENAPAYTTAFDADPCCTSCAVIPSASFKLIYCSDHPADPAPCICTNATLSVELPSSIWDYCLQHCGPKSAPYATSILADYCRLNMAQITTTGSPGKATGTATATEGRTPSAAVPTPTTGTSATIIMAPGGGGSGLTADGKAGVIVGRVIGFIIIVLMIVGLHLSWFSRARAHLANQG